MKRAVVVREMEKVFQAVPYGIDHTLRVLNNAEQIMRGEAVDEREHEVVYLAALLHDIGAVEAQRKYGSMAGHYQEMEGPAIARGILERAGAEVEVIERVCFLVGHHHTPESIDGLDFQILWEADTLDGLEFGEISKDRERVAASIEENFRTSTGKELACRRCGVAEEGKLSEKPERIVRAHRYSSYHRATLERSEVCGCFYCLKIFSPGEIKVWIGGGRRRGRTALCPSCGIDSVIGSASGFPIEKEFLEEMRMYWFG